MNSQLQIACWNVQGLVDPLRTALVQNWHNKFYPQLDILCLQELQADKYRVDVQLSTLFPQGFWILDHNVGHKVGCAIVASSHIHILDSGTKGDGTCAWVSIQSVTGPITIVSVYAPTT